MKTRAWLWPVVVVAGAFAASCTSILGDFTPPGSTGQGGGGGASSTSHTSAHTSSQASTGGAGGGPECKKDGDCMDPPQACLLPFCDGGVCATKPAKQGDPSPKQVPGDCQQIICDANGASHPIVDTTDFDDMKECTHDKCDPDGTPHHDPLTNKACTSDGGTICNMLGNCVQCLDPGDCPLDGACLSFTCQTPSCSDGVKNQDESDVDCGGSCSTNCGDGKHCGQGIDCSSGLCQAGICRPATCDNGMLDTAAGETDTDCGGPCLDCANGKKCLANTDCDSNLCQAAACRIATCGNGVTDGTETDTDCGGTACQHCNTGQTCLLASDCVSGNCITNVCQ
jgi:hypothetical protein